MKTDMKQKFLLDDLDPVLLHDLEIIKDIPPRDPDLNQKARIRFLEEMDAICQKNVIKNSFRRHTRQSDGKIKFRWFGKEFSPMFTQIVLAVLIALSVLGGGGAGAVYASQNSIPGDFLYPVKLLSEDVQLDWTVDPAAQLELNLEMAQERLQEMEQVKLADREIPEESFKGIYHHLENSVQLGARLYADDPEAQQKLNQQVQMQIQNLEQFGPSALSPDVQQLQQQLREQLHTQERAGQQEDETTPEPDASDTDQTTEPEDTSSDDDVNLEADTVLQDRDQDRDQLHDQEQDQDQTQLRLQDSSCTPVAPVSGQTGSSQQQNQGDSSNSQSGNQSSNSDNGNTHQNGKK